MACIDDHHDVARADRIVGEMIEAGAIADGAPLASCRLDQPAGMSTGLALASAPGQKHLVPAIAEPVQRLMIDRRLDGGAAVFLLVVIGDDGMAEGGRAGRPVMHELAIDDIARRDQRHRLGRGIADKAKPTSGPEEHHPDRRAQLGKQDRRRATPPQHQIEQMPRLAINGLVAMAGDAIQVGAVDRVGRQPQAPITRCQDIADDPGRIVRPGGLEAAIPDAVIWRLAGS